MKGLFGVILLGCYRDFIWLVLLTTLKKHEFVNGKDHPIDYGKSKMFQTTNQLYLVGIEIKVHFPNAPCTVYLPTKLGDLWAKCW